LNIGVFLALFVYQLHSTGFGHGFAFVPVQIRAGIVKTGSSQPLYRCSGAGADRGWFALTLVRFSSLQLESWDLAIDLC